MAKRRIIFSVLLVAMACIVALSVTWAVSQPVTSGVKVGGVLGSFRPQHATGADRGQNICPICQYPTNPAVQVWVNGDDEQSEANVAAIATYLEKSTIAHRARQFKAFIVYYNIAGKSGDDMVRHLEAIAEKNHLKNVALVFERAGDTAGSRDNEISFDANVKTTVFVYKAIKDKAIRVSSKFVNLAADPKGLQELEAAVKKVVE